MTDGSQSQDAAIDHVALDNAREQEDERLREEQRARRDQAAAQSEGVAPFFPVGLATSPEHPTQFNFDLFLWDGLRLSSGLLPTDEGSAVAFEDVDDCQRYCERYVALVEQGLPASSRDDRRQSREERRPLFDKQRMFYEAGQPLGDKMRTGNEAFDRNLKELRLDRFGNVMALFAPSWSDLSVHLVHGFPRRLVTEPHGGMVAGNLVVAARISNQAIRSLATGDVACFLSKEMVRGLGLTTSELMLARSGALKYAGKRDKPARLVGVMFRYGVDFLTLESLSREQLRTLADTTSTHWRELFDQPEDPSADPGSSSSDSDQSSAPEPEPQVCLPWETATECANIPDPHHERYTGTVLYHLNRLVSCYLKTVEARPRPEKTAAGPVATRPQAEAADSPTASSSSGQRKRRKQLKPARAVVEEPEAPAAPPSRAPARVEERPTPTIDARQRLLAVRGILPTRLPSVESLQSVRSYLERNLPLPVSEMMYILSLLLLSLSSTVKVTAIIIWNDVSMILPSFSISEKKLNTKSHILVSSPQYLRNSQEPDFQCLVFTNLKMMIVCPKPPLLHYYYYDHP